MHDFKAYRASLKWKVNTILSELFDKFGSEVVKKKFVLNSAEHESFLAHKC